MRQRFGPGVASWGPGRLDVFGVGTGRAMFHRAFDTQSGQWMDDWESLGGKFSSPPAVVSWGPGRLDVFGLGVDRGVYHQAYDRGAWLGDWERLGGLFMTPYPPGVASWGPGRLDVFGVGDDKGLWHQAFDTQSGGWLAGWESLGNRDTLAGSPAVVSRDFDRLDVFCLGSAGSVQHRAWRPRNPLVVRPSDWLPWANLGGGFTGRPAAASWAPDRLDIVTRTIMSGFLMWRSWTLPQGAGTGWSAWRGLGDETTSLPPAAVSWGPERLDVLSVDNGFAHHAPWDAVADPGLAPDSWTSIPGDGNIASAPAAVSWGPGRIDIFAVSTFGDMRHQAFEPASGWMRRTLPIPWLPELGWESLGGVFYESADEWSLF